MSANYSPVLTNEIVRERFADLIAEYEEMQASCEVLPEHKDFDTDSALDSHLLEWWESHLLYTFDEGIGDNFLQHVCRVVPVHDSPIPN